MAVAEKQPVPKWFNGVIYENGMDVKIHIPETVFI